MDYLKHTLGAAALTFGLVASPGIFADQALAQAKGCMACHQVEAKVVGPAYKDIAAKYKSDAAATDTLASKVKSGGMGTWGQIPMPPQATASDDEIKTLVAWILTL